MLVGVYLEPRQASDSSKSAESGNYEAFVVVLYCQLQQKIKECFSRRGDKTELKKFRGGRYWV